jgi:catechol 2,3-dioxygenase-like lactoylglutathione lyase family enzyme
MPNPPKPNVDVEQHHASLAVPDIPAAVDFYTNKLGFRLGFTWGEPPTFAGVNLGDTVQIFLREGTPRLERRGTRFPKAHALGYLGITAPRLENETSHSSRCLPCGARSRAAGM